MIVNAILALRVIVIMTIEETIPLFIA